MSITEQVFKTWATKQMKDRADTIDIKASFDNKLSLTENKNQFIKKQGLKSPSVMTKKEQYDQATEELLFKQKAKTDKIKVMGNSLNPVIKELERAFIRFNDIFYNGNLPTDTMTITIQTKGRRNAFGWFGSEIWRDEKGKIKASEINICAEHLITADKYQPYETLLHEIVHYANKLKGISDCNSNQYHNMNFRREAERVLLGCDKRNAGFTHMTEELKAVIDDKVNPIFDVFNQFRTPKEKKKGGTRLRKWVCNCDTPIIRCSSDNLNARCNNCGENYRLVITERGD